MEIYLFPQALKTHTYGYVSLAAENGPQLTKGDKFSISVDFPLGDRDGPSGASEGIYEGTGRTFLTVK